MKKTSKILCILCGLSVLSLCPMARVSAVFDSRRGDLFAPSFAVDIAAWLVSNSTGSGDVVERQAPDVNDPNITGISVRFGSLASNGLLRTTGSNGLVSVDANSTGSGSYVRATGPTLTNLTVGPNEVPHGMTRELSVTFAQPGSLYTGDPNWFFFGPTKAAIHITQCDVSCSRDPTTEVDADLCYADTTLYAAGTGRAGTTVLHAVDTTAGLYASGGVYWAVPAGKYLFIRRNAAPDATLTFELLHLVVTYD